MSDKSRKTIFLDIGTLYQKLHIFFRSVMPVRKVLTVISPREENNTRFMLFRSVMAALKDVQYTTTHSNVMIKYLHLPLTFLR